MLLVTTVRELPPIVELTQLLTSFLRYNVVPFKLNRCITWSRRYIQYSDRPGYYHWRDLVLCLISFSSDVSSPFYLIVVQLILLFGYILFTRTTVCSSYWFECALNELYFNCVSLIAGTKLYIIPTTFS